MSRVGKQPIPLSEGVTVSIQECVVNIKGPKGELSYIVHPDIKVETDGNKLLCSIRNPSKRAASLWGTTRARLAGCVRGVTLGWEKKLELFGVGYRAVVKDDALQLSVGFSHPVMVKAPAGVAFAVNKETVTVSGLDPYLVGQVAADIRAVRPPEPYKGKGIRYSGEVVRRKVGKAVAAATT